VKLSRRDQLVVAAAVAPVLRDVSVRPKRIAVVDAEGHVKERIDRVEMSRRMLIQQGIDLDTPPGKWPAAKACETCGIWFRVPKRGRSQRLPRWCGRCAADACRCTAIVDGKRCEARLNAGAWSPSSIKKREGRPPVCQSCGGAALAVRGAAAVAARTPEQRLAFARKGAAAANAARTPEQHRAFGRKCAAARTPEQRSAFARKAAAAAKAAITPEQRRAFGRKGAAARRAKKS
jgi:hypothetical protein